MENKKSLAQTHPELAAEWHPTKNGALTPNQVSFGSHQPVWWQCARGHEWEGSIQGRSVVKNPKCRTCNSLEVLRPDLVAEWHPTKNGNLTPEQVTLGSNKTIWWKCSKGPDHEWDARVADRAKGVGCRSCAGYQVSVTNSLAALYPKVALEWHPVNNGKLTPNDVVAGSKQKVWWQCANNHEWIAKIETRTRQKSGCRKCAGQEVSAENSFAALRPDLLVDWHPTKNGSLTPEMVVAGSTQEVWWKCVKGEDHEWEDEVRYRAKKGYRCPYCSGKRVSATNSLAFLYPNLAAEWHPTKNGDLTPDQVTAGSNRRVWWKCPKGPDHEWDIGVVDRTKGGNGCRYCAGAAVSVTNALTTLYPEIAAEWHPTKNGDLTPDQVTTGSSKPIIWQCAKGHEWSATIANRKNGSGCPVCNRGWTLEPVRNFVASLMPHLGVLTPAELYAIFEQSGLLNTQGKARGFIKAFATGRFPLGELEKFVDGEPSLVDVLLGGGTLGVLPNGPDSSLTGVDTDGVLKFLNVSAIKSADEKTVDFLLASAVAKLWKHAYADDVTAIQQAKAYQGKGYGERVKRQFLREYQKAASLKLPIGYSFQANGKPAPPNLMQRHLAVLVQTRKHVGNWSGAGAGKTLSATLASRVIDAKLTVVCCPNNVVDGWKESILNAFPDSVISTKTFYPEWQTSQSQKKTARKQLPHRYLILNYEAFQQPDSAEHIRALIEREQIDFIIIDEIHFAKQRDLEAVSKRRKLIAAMRTAAGQRNPNLHVLGMSATPVINELEEGKSMVELVTGIVPAEVETRPTVFNCMALHRELVKLGIRWVPDYDITCHEFLTPVSCAEFLDEIKNARTFLELERILTQARLPVIREQVQPGTLIYTHLIDGIDEAIQAALVEDGWKVGFFTGKDKSGLSDFLDGKIDVLIGSSAIGTGIDRLQHVCSKLIVNVLPWTAAEYEQLKGRIYRQGQKSDSVSVVIPLAHMKLDGERWSSGRTTKAELKRHFEGV